MNLSPAVLTCDDVFSNSRRRSHPPRLRPWSDRHTGGRSTWRPEPDRIRDKLDPNSDRSSSRPRHPQDRSDWEHRHPVTGAPRQMPKSAPTEQRPQVADPPGFARGTRVAQPADIEHRMFARNPADRSLRRFCLGSQPDLRRGQPGTLWACRTRADPCSPSYRSSWGRLAPEPRPPSNGHGYGSSLPPSTRRVGRYANLLN